MRGLIGVVVLLALVACAPDPPVYVSRYTPPSSTTAPPPGFVDTFNRPDTQLGLGEGWEMLSRLYAPKLPADDGYIRNGAFTYRGDNITYAVRRLPHTVHLVGAEGQWRLAPGEEDTTIALVICGNENLITDMLHLVADRNQWALTTRRANGVFEPVVNGVFAPPLALDQEYRFELSATDTAATVKVPGKTTTTPVDTTGLLSNIVFWEHYITPGQQAGSVFDFNTVWADESPGG